MKTYNPAPTPDNVSITLHVPPAIYDDLIERAEQNGYCLDVEASKRFARTLEEDLRIGKTYNPIPTPYDIAMRLSLPPAIYKGLVERAMKNGCTIDFEASKRFAKTLEKDLCMVEDDNEVAYAAFEKARQAGTL